MPYRYQVSDDQVARDAVCQILAHQLNLDAAMLGLAPVIEYWVAAAKSASTSQSLVWLPGWST